jgi:hypothetical protein
MLVLRYSLKNIVSNTSKNKASNWWKGSLTSVKRSDKEEQKKKDEMHGSFFHKTKQASVFTQSIYTT